MNQQEKINNVYNLFLPFTNDDNLQLSFLFKEFLLKHQEKTKFSSYGLCDVTHVYGTFPKAIWNGGRTLDLQTYYSTFDQIKQRVDYGNSLGIKYHMTFSNSLIKEEHLNNEYCNMILNILDNNNENGIIVNSKLLEQYIKEKYPNLKITSSITRGIDFFSFKESLESGKYDYVVGYPKKNIIEYLSTLPIELQNKAEIFMHRSPCAFCPKFKNHNDADSYKNLNGILDPTYPCIMDTGEYDKTNLLLTHPEEDCKSVEYMLQKYNCIHNFKIQGRGENNHILIDSFIELIFLPEYKEELIKEFYNIYNSVYKIF